jgi:uncharacterized protein YjiS (DUF1127 family)
VQHEMPAYVCFGSKADVRTTKKPCLRRRMRQRRELLMLNDIELRELSLSEADVKREARKPFWEAIRLTGR